MGLRHGWLGWSALTILIVFLHAPSSEAANTHAAVLNRASAQFFSAADSPSLSITGNLTIEAWVKLASQPGSGSYTIASKSTEGGGHASFTFRYLSLGSRLDASISANGGSVVQVSVPHTLPTEQWTHVAMAYTAAAGTITFYVNSVQTGAAQTGLPNAIFDSTAAFLISGYDAGHSATLFNGQMDDVRLWAAARSPAQINAAMSRELLGTESNLRGYWKLNNSLADSSPNGNTLVNNGGATFQSTNLPFTTNISPSLTDGLWGWWSFNDGTAADNSGNGRNGTLISNPGVVEGWSGKALHFDGLDDAVAVGFVPTFSNLTVSAFVRTDSYPTPHNGGSWASILDAGPSPDVFGIRADYRTGTLRFFAYYQYNPGGVSLISTSVVELGRFYHVALTIDSAKARLYVDGNLEVETSTAGFLIGTFGLSPLVIGNRTLNEIPFPGTLDEVRLYDRALLPSEVRFLKNPILITNQPTNAFSLPGGSVTFSVGVQALPPWFYQWYYNATNILANETNASLSVPNVQPVHVGAYSVVVSSDYGSVLSSNAFLYINNPGFDDDGDGLSNELEIQFGTNPVNPDTDGDGLSDYVELFVHGTDPLKPDTDGDGLPDKWEVDHGLNPRHDDANDDLDGDGVSNKVEFENALHPQAVATSGGTNDFQRVFGERRIRHTYDKIDRLIATEYANGLALVYQYDGNGNLLRQMHLKQDTNTLPILWRFLNGLTNTFNVGANDDADGDGWSNYQEWKAGSNPLDTNSRPNHVGNPGTNIASLVLPFTPSNFVVGVGQLDGGGAEEIVIGADGNPGTNNNFLLVLTQTFSGWTTQRVDVGPFGVTSLAIGQLTNRPAPAIYAGLRGTTNGSGRIVELIKVGGMWQTNVVATSTTNAAFVLGVQQDVGVVASYAVTNLAGFPLFRYSFAFGSWSSSLLSTNSGGRGLGLVSPTGTNATAPLRLLDQGGIEINGNARPLPTNAVYRANSGSWFFITPNTMTWSNAESFAQTYGGHLASIADASENEFVRSLASSAVGVDSWIGFNDAAVEGVFVWSSGEQVTFANWNSGEPNNLGNEDAAQIFIGNGKWNDNPTSSLLYGVIEVSAAGSVISVILPEPVVSHSNNWRGSSLAAGLVRGTNASSVFYAFADDMNANGLIDRVDSFIIAEYLLNATNVSLLTTSRQTISSATVAQSYGLASVNYLNRSNEVFFTGEPDGQVFAWTAKGATNPLQRQLFSANYAGKGWQALAGVKTLEPGEGLAGLLVDPATPNKCDVILWPPQSQLPSTTDFPQTAPLARILPSPNVGGAMAAVQVRIWDGEGNASLPLLEYQNPTTLGWSNAVIVTVNGAPWSFSTRVAALPTGSSNLLIWNAGAAFASGTVTNVNLRVRARDVSLLGDWSVPMPYHLTIVLDADGDGLPDGWEIASFGNLNQTANGDFDGDGFSNMAEYLAGTNPADANSSLKLRIERLSGAVRLSWQGGSNAAQVLQRSSAIPLGWQNLFTSPPSMFTAFTNPVSSTNYFFQLRLQP